MSQFLLDVRFGLKYFYDYCVSLVLDNNFLKFILGLFVFVLVIKALKYMLSLKV